MRFYGSIAFDWQGQALEAHAPPTRSPEAIVALHPEWVAVGTPMGGTKLVSWESVRELRGWAPVAEEDRR